ncbi:sulfate transporter protein [Rutstroemia sp. NJR-2017a BBW]|nr:sulfate transporter protein [Rutstroemia sp. NJR-2017a BBW]
MVVFVDLEDEKEPPEQLHRGFQKPVWGGFGDDNAGIVRIGAEEGRENPNKNACTEALGCYPIITSIASHIDLNTLDALSHTCRQIRVNLLQFRSQLLVSTLHCENEDVELDPENTFRYRARAADWYFVESGSAAHGSGKVGDCARDMVGECRRCSRVVCRNCTIKSPSSVDLLHRHRRICKTCSKAPLAALINPSLYTPSSTTPEPAPTLGPDTIKRAICSCPTAGVWLCQPCGRSLLSGNKEYESIWKWRTRYLRSLGGLGVGIGEGNRGVPCGRGAACLAAIEVEHETDCDAEDARDYESSISGGASPGVGSGQGLGMGQGTAMRGPGYARHEIEGIGGVVKKKRVRMVRVGACVPEWEEERGEWGRVLVREKEGRARSWCGWCWRVVPGRGEVME